MTKNRQDMRWVRSFEQYQRALLSLQEAIQLSQQRGLTSLERLGLIHGFELTHELAWNTLKDFLERRGISGVIGSRDAARVAFREGLVTEGAVWMEMIESRCLSADTYREAVANDIAEKISNQYLNEFVALQATLLPWVKGNEE